MFESGFFGERPGNTYVVTVGGFQNGAERPLQISGLLVFRPYRDYDVTPDGQWFLAVFPEDQTDVEPGFQITIVLNWFEELKARVPVP